MITITLKDCNNISNGSINIVRNQLNIKYGINGTGKSTIASAIKCFFEDKINNSNNNMQTLLPYKYRDGSSNTTIPQPIITGLDDFQSVMIFNEDYLRNIVLKEKEIVKGSFEIFVKDSGYDNRMIDIQKLIEGLGNVFQIDPNINQIIDSFTSLTKQAKTTQSGGLHGSSEFTQALENGNLIENIPHNLEGYRDFIKNENRVNRINRQIQGDAYLDINDKCPCCIADLNSDKKQKIKSISARYNKNKIGYLQNVISNFEKLQDYFDPETREKIENILKKGEAITDQEKQYIVLIKDQADVIVNILNNIRTIGFHSLKNETNIEEKVKGFIIQKELINYFKSDLFNEKIDLINEQLNKLIDEVRILLGKINNHKNLIRRNIENTQMEINGFLDNAGYNYCIDSIEDKDTYKMILKPKDTNVVIDEKNNGLSFGERNAFALVLFMFNAVHRGVDLIILDDPISSFDNNKKFAILDMLFSGGKNNLLNKTVLILTHDFEPVIDIIYNQLPKSLSNSASAYFVSNTNGVLNEKQIQKKDIILCTNLLKNKIALNNTNKISKLIYLRRYLELMNSKDESYNIISSLLHKRISPNKLQYNTTLSSMESINLSEDEISIFSLEIKKHIVDFDYSKYLSLIMNDRFMIDIFENTQCNYEKLQIYRVIFEKEKNTKQEEVDDDYRKSDASKVILKFINESFHIENDMLFQLDPIEYEVVPSYVINECNNYISKLKQSLNYSS